ncbi:MAG: O-antigen ligase family protein [Bdellovibrionales bacterium]|nr:O-antigen ligase family protein [Bdellovibrionales bacterium]
MKSTQVRDIMVTIIFIVSVWAASQIVLNDQVKWLVMGIIAVSLCWLIISVDDSSLLLIILVVLALGSCFHRMIAAQSFYLRFYILLLVGLKSLQMRPLVGSRAIALSGAIDEKSPSNPLDVGSHSKVIDQKFVEPNQTAVISRFSSWSLYHIFFVYLCIYGLVSSIYSVDPILSFQRALSFVLLFVVVGVYFWNRINSLEDIENILQTFWKMLVLVFVSSLIFLLWMPSQMKYAGRFRFVLGNPNQLGHYCAVMFPIAVWVLFENRKKKWLSTLVLIGLPILILASGSRAAIIASILSVGALAFFCYKKNAIYIVLTGVFVLALSILLNTDVNRPDADPTYFREQVIRERTLDTGSGRLGVWKSSWYLIKQKPMLGYGFGVTDRLFQLKFFPDLPLDFQGGHTHNGYLEELINLGFVGAMGFFILIIFFHFLGLKFLFHVVAKSEFAQPMHVAIYCSVVAGTISGVFESWFSSVGSFFCFPFWLLGVLLVKLDRMRQI